MSRGNDNKKKAEKHSGAGHSKQGGKSTVQVLSKIGGEGKYFNGGSPVRFNVVKDQIIRAFKAQKVYRFIEFHPEAEPDDILEDEFVHEEPTHENQVDVPLAEAITRANECFELGRDDIMDSELLTPAERNEKIRLATHTHRRDIMAVENSRVSYEANFERSVERWNKERDKWDDYIATLHKVFQTVFGPIILRGVKGLLEDNQFRAAWYKICKENDRAADGQNNTSILLDELENVEFDARYMTFAECEAEIESIMEQLEMLGEPGYTDQQKLHKLVKTMKRSPGREFEALIDRIETDNTSYTDARNSLMRKAGSIATNKTFERIHNGKGGSGPTATLNMGVSQSESSKTGAGTVQCTKCKKPGHRAADCWSGLTCNHCGMKGHIEAACREKRKAKRQEEKDTKSLDGGSGVGNRFSNNGNAKKDGKYLVDFFDCTVKEVDTHVCAHSTDHRVGHETESYLNTTLQTLQVKTVPISILVDTGASNHMLPRSLIVRNYAKSAGTVRLGDSTKRLSIMGVGDTYVRNVTGVLHVQGLSVGILAVCQFDRAGFKSTFMNGRGMIYDTCGNVFMTSTLIVEGVYLLDPQYVEYLMTGRLPSHTEVTIQPCASAFALSSTNVKRSERVGTPETRMTSEYSGTNQAWGDFPGTLPISEKHCSDTPICATVDMVTTPESPLSSVIPTATLEGKTPPTEISTDEVASTENKSTSGHTSLPGEDSSLNPLEILHRQWGHMSADGIKSTLKSGAVKGCKYTYKDVQSLHMRRCEHCLQGRMRAKSERGTTDHNWQPCGKIAIDYKGDFARMTVHREKGFMLMVDYATNWVHADLVKSKAEHTRTLQDFKIKVVKRYQHEWKVLQSDSESIFKSLRVRSWLRKNEIRLQLSTPYQHWENGQVEVYVRIVMDKTRTIMVVYHTPVKYWGYGVLYTCYILNRTPNSNTGISAFEAMTGEKPDLSNAVPFYAPGVYHLTADERKGPWSPKARPCRMLGYADEYLRAYVILSVDTGKIIVRENCVFNMADVIPDLDEIEVDQEADRDDINEFEIMINEASDEEESDSDSDVSEVVDPFEVENEVVIDYGGDNPYWHAMLEDLQSLTVDVPGTEYLDWRHELLYATGVVAPLPPNPKGIPDALKGPHAELWEAAIRKELDQFRIRTTFGPAEQVGRGMKTKLILYYKYDGEYNLVCKARLVVCGYSQKKGVDYFETYSPTTTTVTVFTMLCLAGYLNSQVCMFDVSAAFLEGKADTRMFAWLPADIDNDGVSRRIEILGNWYGSKQAGKIWNDLFDAIIVKLGFERCIDNPCLYRWTNGVHYIYLTVHVDDGLLLSSSLEIARGFMSEFRKHVRKVVMYETVKLYLSMDITRSADGRTFHVSQERYIEDCCSEYSKKYHTPMSTDINLRETIPNTTNDSLLPITGKLRYLADRGRPDILQALGDVSTGGSVNPSDSHCGVAARIRHYLTNTKSLSLHLGGTDPIVLFGYSDAAYVTKGNCKSRLGGCLFLNKTSGAVSSISRNDSTVSHSSTEAEIKAIDMMCREIVRMRQLLEFLGCKQDEPTVLFVDNTSAIELCRTLKTTSKTGHINVRIHYIRELINARVVVLMFIPSTLNVSDILTKALVRALHERHTTILLRGHGAIQDGTTLFLSVLDYPTQDNYFNDIENEGASEMLLATID